MNLPFLSAVKLAEQLFSTLSWFLVQLRYRVLSSDIYVVA
jgi:hypothetical protein